MFSQQCKARHKVYGRSHVGYSARVRKAISIVSAMFRAGQRFSSASVEHFPALDWNVNVPIL
jgi:hypothetical protein